MIKKLLAVCLLILAVVGCGGGDDPTTNNHGKTKKDKNKYELPFTRKYTGGSPIVTVKLNGHSISGFVWDTGAEMTCISSLEFKSLKKSGKISEDDFVGVGNFTNATGGSTQELLFKIKEIALPCNSGKELKCYDVEISVSENPKAPMLLGQNVMQQLPKCSVNDLKEVIVFE